MAIYKFKFKGRKLISTEITKKWSVLKDTKTGETFDNSMIFYRDDERDVYIRAKTEDEAKKEAIAIIKEVVKE